MKFVSLASPSRAPLYTLGAMTALHRSRERSHSTRERAGTKQIGGVNQTIRGAVADRHAVIHDDATALERLDLRLALAVGDGRCEPNADSVAVRSITYFSNTRDDDIRDYRLCIVQTFLRLQFRI